MHFIFSSCTPAVVIERSPFGVGWLRGNLGLMGPFIFFFWKKENFIVKERVGYCEAAQEFFGAWG